MEKYRKTLQMRTLIMKVCVSGFVLFNIYSRFFMSPQTGEGIIRGFQEGLLIGLIAVFLVLIIKYSRALTDDLSLKRLYLKSIDERKKAIMDKSGGYIIIICAGLIMTAGIIGGYFNKTIFYSLVGCAYFLLSVKGVLKVYYIKKY